MEQPKENDNTSRSKDTSRSKGTSSAKDIPYPKEGQIFVPLNPIEDQPIRSLSNALNL